MIECSVVFAAGAVEDAPRIFKRRFFCSNSCSSGKVEEDLIVIGTKARDDDEIGGQVLAVQVPSLSIVVSCPEFDLVSTALH